MVSYLYDGSFAGFLTALNRTFEPENPDSSIQAKDRFVPTLFSEPVVVETDVAVAQAIASRIRSSISSQALHHVYYAFLSELPEVENHTREYVSFGWEVGRKVDQYVADDRVLRVHHSSQKVGFERHRMLGLLRFRQLEGDVYYAPFEPDHNILEIVAPHFADRLARQRWIIHDVRRARAAVYNGEDYCIVPMEFDDLPFWDRQEPMYQRIWQEFFNSVAIAERHNPRLQKNHMPVRYWKYLIELDT